MKKIVFSMLLMIVLIIGSTGCSNNMIESAKPATIINNIGETEELTAAELQEIDETNEAKFKKKYLYAKISFDGTIDSITTDDCETIWRLGDIKSWVQPYPRTKECVTIYFKEKYELVVPSNMIDAAEIDKGDKYHVESNIVESGIHRTSDNIKCYGIEDDNIPNKKLVNFSSSKIEKID